MNDNTTNIGTRTAFKPSVRDLSACQQLIKHGSRSFYLASQVLPRRIALPATALYAFCRVADDIVDADDRSPTAISDLTARLDAIYAGKPGADSEDRAMAEVVKHCAIPRSMPDALIEGLSWDADGREYETLSDLYQYAARVAGCVGAMMCLIMGTSDKRAMARACDLGVAMQLTNIARDIGEDARMGRLYLPREWFHEYGLDPDEWLSNPVEDYRVAAMCQRLLQYADQLYTKADSGISVLPLSCRPGIYAARLIYSDIGREIMKADYNSVAQRAIVPMQRKVSLLLTALFSAPFRNRKNRQNQLSSPALDETQFLMNDVDSIPLIKRREWVLNLFIVLQHREQS